MAVLFNVNSVSRTMNASTLPAANFPIGASLSLSPSELTDEVKRKYKSDINDLMQRVIAARQAAQNMDILNDCTFCFNTTQTVILERFDFAINHLKDALNGINDSILSQHHYNLDCASSLQCAVYYLNAAARNLQDAKDYLNDFHSNSKKLSEQNEKAYKELEATVENLTRNFGNDSLPGADYLSQKLSNAI